MLLDYKRGRGHRPNHPSRRPKSAFQHAEFAAIISSDASVPDAVDNSARLPQVFDQGPTGTCEAHTEIEAIVASLSLNGTPLEWVPSPDFVYRTANGLQRAAYNLGVPAAQLPPLEDNGLEPAFATIAAQTFGLVRINAPTPDGRYSDCDPATINREVDPSEFVQGALKILRGTASLDVLDSMRVDAVKRLLAAGKILKVALFADYQAFYDYGPDSAPLSAPPPNGGSDHAVTLHSYFTSNGQPFFKLRNHWSSGWGKGGDFEIDASFLLALTDLEVVDAKLVTMGGAP